MITLRKSFQNFEAIRKIREYFHIILEKYWKFYILRKFRENFVKFWGNLWLYTRLSKNNRVLVKRQKYPCGVQLSSGAYPWSILHQRSKFHLVVTFHCRVTTMFVKVVFVTSRKFKLSKTDVKNEQKSVIKFCYRFKNSAAVIVKLKHEVYTDDKWLEDLTIFHWHKAFSKGKETAALLPHVGRQLSICAEEMVNTVVRVIWEDRHITVRQLAQALDISKPSVHTILYEKSKMRTVTACWVPHFLTREQRDHCIEIRRKWLKRIEDEPDVMGCVITLDENWIYHFNPATKQESMHWKSSQSLVNKKVCPAKSMNKVLLILFFYVRGAI